MICDADSPFWFGYKVYVPKFRASVCQYLYYACQKRDCTIFEEYVGSPEHHDRCLSELSTQLAQVGALPTYVFDYFYSRYGWDVVYYMSRPHNNFVQNCAKHNRGDVFLQVYKWCCDLTVTLLGIDDKYRAYQYPNQYALDVI